MSLTFKLNQESVRKSEDTVRRAFDRVIKSRNMLTLLGDTIVKDIQFQTRRGVSSVTGNQFKRLGDTTGSKKWVKLRGQIAAAQGTHAAYSQKRSNLTLSGQLLDAVNYTIQPARINFFFTGTHQPYRAAYSERSRKSKSRKVSRTIGKPLQNAKLADYVSLLRPFFGVRKSLYPRLNRMVVAAIRRSSRVLGLFD